MSFSEGIQEQLEGYLQKYLHAEFLLSQSTQPEGLDSHAYAEALQEALEPLQKLVFLPGKRWRPSLTLLHFLLHSSEGAEEIIAPVSVLVELLHNATLIADDIEDGGTLRRGIPALHLSYGIDRALNSCNWAYFLSHTLLQTLRIAGRLDLALQLESLKTQCLGQIHLGQALDIRWHRHHDYIPTSAEYFCMAMLKTGVLAGFAAEAGALCAGATAMSIEYRKLWQRIGRSFQVLDDVVNITLGNPGKLRGDDWLEGKKSLPLCLYVHGNKIPDYIAVKPVPETGGLSGTQKLRQQKLAQWLQRMQGRSQEEQEVELVQVLQEFWRDGRDALMQSIDWLDRELKQCRNQAVQLYSSPDFTRSGAVGELLTLLEQLDVQAGECRRFLSEV